MHKTFFGDRARVFSLPPHLILELERLTGRGIGSLCHDLVQGRFHHSEITETIRLALIGGGTAPEEAAALIKAYVDASPLGAAHILAADILTDLWAGTEQKVNQET